MKIKWIRRFLRVGIFSLYGVILNVVLVAFAILIELFAWEWNDLIYSLFFPYYEIVNSSSAFSTSFIDFTLIAFLFSLIQWTLYGFLIGLPRRGKERIYVCLAICIVHLLAVGYACLYEF